MAPSSKQRQPVARTVIAFVVVLMLVPGGIFFAKGLLTLTDRLAGRTSMPATLVSTEIDARSSADGSTNTTYVVLGRTAAGRDFEINDRAVYGIANGRTPLPVVVETSNVTGRVVTLRSDFGNVEDVGGATSLSVALLGLGAGALLAAIPFMLPWQPAVRKRAKQRGRPPPPVDMAALRIVSVAAVVIVCATIAWDLLR